jgi:hypothetical protein
VAFASKPISLTVLAKGWNHQIAGVKSGLNSKAGKYFAGFLRRLLFFLDRRPKILTFVVPALAVCLVVYSHFWGWRVGIMHTALVGVWSVLLMEGLLARFRKIPFTCSLPKFKSHVIVSATLLVLGYFAFTSVTATVESWALADPFWFIAFVPVALGASVVLYRWRNTMVDSDRHLLFEEQSITVVEVLDLSS